MSTPVFARPNVSYSSSAAFAVMYLLYTAAVQAKPYGIISSKSHSVPLPQAESPMPSTSAESSSRSFVVENNRIVTPDLRRNLATLQEIADLQPNWNENGADSFSSDLIRFAASILEQLPVQPDVFPTARNSIQLEFNNQKGDYLEFELFDGEKVKMFYMLASGKHASERINPQILISRVGKFYE